MPGCGRRTAKPGQSHLAGAAAVGVALAVLLTGCTAQHTAGSPSPPTASAPDRGVGTKPDGGFAGTHPPGRETPSAPHTPTVSPAPIGGRETGRGTGGHSGNRRHRTTRRPAGTALAAAQSLTVKGRAPMTGYSREQFGQAWSDDTADIYGHNACDTRNDILRRDLTRKRIADRCVVMSGSLHDPYTGYQIAFVRGEQTSQAVQIDHVVALGDAWQTGAQRLSMAARLNLANDPLELIAVDGPTNEQKGDADAASWLPPNTAFRCAYVARQIAVKRKYHLWATAAERQAMIRVLSRCPALLLPTEVSAQRRTWPGFGRPRPASGPRYRPPPPSRRPPGGSVYYANCDEARDAGAAPIYRGQPGYRPELDGDGDGVACE